MPDEILSIKELAALLKLAETTVYAMANVDEIPAFKIRRQWRIKAGRVGSVARRAAARPVEETEHDGKD